ncbi:MAG: TetR/AcrR family transcriptional regulator [Verrucomicrobia bacterium]|nr:TetR/AcrR family transcriptional regulator [Verrucomicrobiota bacterium]
MTKKSNARERILETAGRLFHENGYCGVGVNQIIEEADTAKATFYQHFPSKMELCVTWLDVMHEASEEARADLLASEVDPAEKIDQYFTDLERFLEERQFRGCPFTNTSSITDACCDSIRKKIEEHKISIRDFFRDLARQFAPSESRAKEIGDELFLLYSGATMEAQNLRAIWPVRAARRAARERCVNEQNK